MASRHASTFHAAVGNLLRAAGFRVEAAPVGRVALDYIFEDGDGVRTALKVERGKAREDEFDRLAKYFATGTTGIDRFVCVSEHRPLKFQHSLFERAFGKLELDAAWVGGGELPGFLRLDGEIDFTSPLTLDRLQVAAITTPLEKYATPARTEADRALDIGAILEHAGAASEIVPPEYRALGRQFSYQTIAALRQKNQNIDEALRLGERVADVTVVLSDAKNFSRIVKAAAPDDLKRAMTQYYRRARELVWDHGGTLDKFIGDAVLAIFGYPLEDDDAARGAVSFCRDLVALGQRLFGELTAGMNDVIETGTRTGVCSGDVWVLDIGKDDVEVAFFGDVINLAARLEARCEVDGCLVDHRTYRRLADTLAGSTADLKPTRRDLDQAEAKGQANTIRAWQFSPASLVGIPPDAG